MDYKMEKSLSIMDGKGEWNEEEHPRDEEGKFTEKGKVKTRELTKPNSKGIIHLESSEYAVFCSTIRTKYANKIPSKGNIFLNNYFCLFRYDKKTERLICKKKILIVGNEDVIDEILRRKNGFNKN